MLALALHLKRSEGWQLLGWKSWTVNACRILDRLQKAELSEPDIWFRQEIRQAFICVSLAGRGEAQPFVQSSCRMYGIHPDKICSVSWQIARQG